MANITKQALIQEIAKSTGFVRNDIKTVIEQFLDLLGEKLIEGNETVLIEERMVPSFKFSNDIKDKINSLEALVEGVNAKLEAEDRDVMISAQPQEIQAEEEA